VCRYYKPSKHNLMWLLDYIRLRRNRFLVLFISSEFALIPVVEEVHIYYEDDAYVYHNVSRGYREYYDTKKELQEVLNKLDIKHLLLCKE